MSKAFPGLFIQLTSTKKRKQWEFTEQIELATTFSTARQIDHQALAHHVPYNTFRPLDYTAALNYCKNRPLL